MGSVALTAAVWKTWVERKIRMLETAKIIVAKSLCPQMHWSIIQMWI